MLTCFKLLHLTSHLKECQTLEILSSIIFLASSGFRMLLALHPQCLVLEKTLNTGQGHVTDIRQPVSIRTGGSQLHPFKNKAVVAQNTLPFCFQGSPYHSAYCPSIFSLSYAAPSFYLTITVCHLPYWAGSLSLCPHAWLISGRRWYKICQIEKRPCTPSLFQVLVPYTSVIDVVPLIDVAQRWVCYCVWQR